MSIQRDETKKQGDEPLVWYLQQIILFVVRALAILMVIVIFWGVAHLVHALLTRASSWESLFEIRQLVSILSIFLAVMVAVEIFGTLVLYLRKGRFALEIVLASAITAIAREIIVLDFAHVEAEHAWALAGLIFALAVAYKVTAKEREEPWA